MSIYELKPRFQALLRPTVVRLHAMGATANQVTLATCAVSVSLGLGIYFAATAWLPFVLIPLWMLLRMAFNAVDGMLAREHGQQTRLGAFLNELTDVLSDAALYLPFVLVPAFSGFWIGTVIVLAGLSEFAGAISTLSHTLAINPWDIEGTAGKMHQAMTMPKEERIARVKTMQDYLKQYNATMWAKSFIEVLQKGVGTQRLEGPPTIKADSQAIRWLGSRILASNPERMTMFIDYDGTLVPIRSKPEEAVLDEETREALLELSSYSWLDLVIVSGRDSKFL
ncbi:MAG: hypothetical protein EOO27_36920, partial [Comamonadaceae bacterium]